jgi:hypothetical protein
MKLGGETLPPFVSKKTCRAIGNKLEAQLTMSSNNLIRGGGINIASQLHF